MSGMPQNPVAAARETVAIARETGSPTFEKVARWSLIVSAAATAVTALAHTVRSIARDFLKKPNAHAPAARHARPAASTHAHAEPPGHDPIRGDGRSWVEKTRYGESEDHRWQKRHAYREAHDHGGRR
jgi:hypothetical protein